MNKYYSLVKYLIGWPLSLVALVFVARIIYSNSSVAFKSIEQVNYFLLAIGILLFVFFFFLKAYTWKLLLGEKGKTLSFRKNAFYLATAELKRYIPGNIWGFAARATIFENNNLSKREVFSYIIKESVLFSLSSLIISLVYILSSESTPGIKLTVLSFTTIATILFLLGKHIYYALNFNLLKKIIHLLIPTYSFLENFKILSWSILSFILFGIGTYFSIISIFSLDFSKILIFVGIFNLSFFIGYISLITPMGLGVREGAMSLLLSSFLSATSAAVASIFSRVIFIVSELLTLFIIYIWNKVSPK